MTLPKNNEELLYRIAVLPGWIEVRKDGSIWRVLQRRKSRWDGTVTVKPVTPHRVDAQIGESYRTVKVMIDGKQTSCPAHRLVWRTLVGPIPPGLTINHKDGKKGRNHPDNLELATYPEQAKHAVHVLGLGRTLKQWGEANLSAKLTTAQVLEIRKRRKNGEKLTQIAEDYGVTFQTISRIARKDRRFHG